MPDLKHDYIEQHLDDPDLVKRFPNFKARHNECERQFLAGKQSAGGQEEKAEAKGPASTELSAGEVQDQFDKADALFGGKPQQYKAGAATGIEELNDALGAIADAPARGGEG